MPQCDLITGTITNMISGEESFSLHYLYPAPSIMKVVVKVLRAEVYEHPEGDNPYFQVSVNALALDSIGQVFPVGLEFNPTLREDAQEIVSSLTGLTYLTIDGHFCVTEKDISLHDPVYAPLPADKIAVVKRIFAENHEHKDANLAGYLFEQAKLRGLLPRWSNPLFDLTQKRDPEEEAGEAYPRVFYLPHLPVPQVTPFDLSQIMVVCDEGQIFVQLEVIYMDAVAKAIEPEAYKELCKNHQFMWLPLLAEAMRSIQEEFGLNWDCEHDSHLTHSLYGTLPATEAHRILELFDVVATIGSTAGGGTE